jgi:hypothetical protein
MLRIYWNGVKYSMKAMLFCCMAKQERYKVAQNLIQTGGIKTVSELLTLLDKKAIYADIMSPERFDTLLVDPSQFRFSDAYAIAAKLGVEDMEIIQLVHNEYLSHKKKRK